MNRTPSRLQTCPVTPGVSNIHCLLSTLLTRFFFFAFLKDGFWVLLLFLFFVFFKGKKLKS